MAKSDPGSALVSATVQQTIRGPVADRLVSRGLFHLDKMAETIEAFEIAGPAPQGAIASLQRTIRRARILPRLRAANWALIALLAAGVAIVLAVMTPLTTPVSEVRAADKSIAILPFEDRSPSKSDSEYGDWLSELISGLLGKASNLRVISQTSASTFKGKGEALPDIAKKLGVVMVVEGSVNSEGDDTIIRAQLINAATDTQLWADVYERKTDNALSTQSEVAGKVAAAIAAALNVTISQAEQQALTPTTNAAAFEDYAEALKLYRTTTEANVRAAESLLQEAVKLDEDFALAWALLSRVHSYLYFNRSDATEDRRALAKEALDQALNRKKDLAEVMLAAAYYEYWVKRDYEGARAQFETLSAKWPNNADVLTALASITRRQGRWDESKAYFERAVAIDPLRPGRRVKAAELQLATRDFDGAVRQLDASLKYWPKAPDNVAFIAKKATVYQAQGRLDEADALLTGLNPEPDGDLVEPIAIQALLRRAPDSAIRLLDDLLKRDQAARSIGRTSIDLNIYLGNLRQLAGDAKGAKINYAQALDELRLELAKQPDNADIHSYLALAYCGLGDRTQAVKYAALAVKEVPIEKDALSGAYYLDVQARVWARLGDRERAIPAIAALMKLPAPLPLTPALLNFDPAFDKLRTDARFKALLN
jgi:TolB-like protein/predicted Zn-dependent protease